MSWWRWSALVLASSLAVPVASVAQAPSPAEVRFVVLGHIRGDAQGLNPKLGELLEEVRTLDPAFVVLTGDIIWGDVHAPMADPRLVETEWAAIDSAVGTLGVPVYRVPGNHDISDVPSRDVWVRRYGSLPQAVATHGLRLILLSSAWIPEDGDTLHNPHVRGVDLDSAQVRWLTAELARPAPGPTLVFLHHLLWWEEDDGRWWREVHPVLSEAGTSAVFSGDYGPLKFSALERDGVRYYQSSIELPVSLPILRNRISSRVLSAQFDNYFEVVVRDSAVEVRVHTLAEESSREFTPTRYRAITEIVPVPPAPAWRRAVELIWSPKRMTGVLVGLGLTFALGVLVGHRWRGRRAKGSA